jgi:glutamate N-acetyltransferase/amino-acid N-acetyltransferase
VCSAGTSIDYDEGVLEQALKAKEVEYEITLGGRDLIHSAETEVFFSDLSHEYVTINADYTT